MKTKVLYIIGIMIILFSLYIVAKYYENGDNNAALMYLSVYSIPLTIISLINCSLLKFAEKICNKKIPSIILVFLFPIISIALIFTNDNSFNLFGSVGIIAFGITNLIWYLNFKILN
jgi:hypothetical protein|nr:hypothetical protein [uncultured Flavobacterium sp.]